MEEAIATLEAQEGPIPEHVKAQLRQHMASGSGNFTVANTPAPVQTMTGSAPRPTLDQVPINSYGGGAFTSRTPEEQAAATKQAELDVQLRNAPAVAGAGGWPARWARGRPRR